ncbi:MAG: sugar ABC transporter substrate-binding protein [Alicyclobacillus sp.]|nr:sugar ABC transporter substrate-binding protein [Alicyclobacillus sp.]
MIRKKSAWMPVVCAASAAISTLGGTGVVQATTKQDSKAPVVIRVWVQQFETYTNNWIKKWTDDFNKTHTSVQVALSLVPANAWAQKLKAAQAAGVAPDVETYPYNGVLNAAAQGQIMPLNRYIKPKVWNDVYPNIRYFVEAKGKYYAFPWLVEPSSVLYYRKDLFKAAGLDPNKPPTTWAQLIADAKKLTKNGVFGLKIAGNAGEYAWTTWGMQFHFGNGPINDTWSKSTVLDPGNREGYTKLLTFFKTLYADGVVPKQELAPYVDGTDFGEGKEAMAITGSWVIGQLRANFPKIVPDVGVAPAPAMDGNQKKPTATLGGWTLAIDGKSKHPQQAAEYITWLLGGNPHIMFDFFKASGFSKFTPRKSVNALIDNYGPEKNDAWRKVVAEDIVPYSVPEPIYPWDISMAVGNAIEAVIQGQSVSDALTQMDKNINAVIANEHVAGTNPRA